MPGSDLSVLNTSAPAAARQLLGWTLMRTLDDGQRLSGRIVETEAYDQTDAASHSYKGRTPRTEVMFGPAGYLYVYFTYGMHYCCNVVVGAEGMGAAVLLRGLEPLSGVEAMSVNRLGRGGSDGRQLTNGPAKLCQALAIDRSLNGHDLTEPPLVLAPPASPVDEAIVQTTRIGIKHAADVPWRFYIKDNDWVSRK